MTAAVAAADFIGARMPSSAFGFTPFARMKAFARRLRLFSPFELLFPLANSPPWALPSNSSNK
jgi:hypothetical protein